MQPVNDDDLAGNKEAEDCVNVMSSKTTTSIGVLRPQSSFSGIKLGTIDSGESIPVKRLTFADEHGDILVVNVFVDQLHYGHNSNSLPSMGSVSTGKCCSVS